MSLSTSKWTARLTTLRRGRSDAMTVKPPKPRSAKPVPLRWTPELVARFWDGVSQTSLNDLSFAKQGGRGLAVVIDHLLPRDGRIVDFGAGDGDMVRHLAQRGFKVAAYEPSSDRCASLSERLADCPGFLGTIGDHGRERFDAAVMAEVVEHILDDELEETLGRLASLVRRGGTLIVTTPDNEDLDQNMVYCPVSNTVFHRWQHVRSFTRESLCALLDGFGFDEVVTHHLPFDDRYYVPWDNFWGDPGAAGEPPDYLAQLRRNEPTRIGNQSNLLFVGRKRNGLIPMRGRRIWKKRG